MLTYETLASGTWAAAERSQAAVQVVAAVPSAIAMQLMHAAMLNQDVPSAGMWVQRQGIAAWLSGLPAHLQALAYEAHAGSQCMHTHRTLHDRLSDDTDAEFVTRILPHLPALTAVKLTVNCALSTRHEPAQDAILIRLMQAVVSREHLKTLHLTLHRQRSPLDPPVVEALADGLGRRTQLECLLLTAAGCNDPAAAAALARGICAQTHLTRLELSGPGLVQSIAPTLTTCMQSLEALRRLHISDDSMSSTHTAAIVGAAAELPELQDLLLGGAACTLHIGSDGSSLRRMHEDCPFAPPACPADCATRLTADSGYTPGIPPLPSRWSGLGVALQTHAPGLAQLTRLALVRSVCCEDMLGLGAALACMPHLRALSLVMSGPMHDDHSWEPGFPLCCEDMFATRHLLPGLAAATALATLELAGLNIVQTDAEAVIGVLGAMPGLRRLVLSDVAPSRRTGHIWELAARALAAAMASGACFPALEDLHLQSAGEDVAPVAAEALAAALGSLSALTALNFALPVIAWHLPGIEGVDPQHDNMVPRAMEGALRRLPGLRELSLHAGRGPLPDLQQLGRLTKLSLQLQELMAPVLQGVVDAIAVPEHMAAVAQAGRWGVAEGMRSSGLRMLRVLELSCAHGSRGYSYIMRVLLYAVRELPQLQELRLRGAAEAAAEMLAQAFADGAQGVRVCTPHKGYQAAISSADAASDRELCRTWELCDCGSP